MFKIESKGFTLVEMLVLITIIGILLSLIIPKYFSYSEHKNEKLLRHELIVMRSALSQYISDKKTYPESLDELVNENYLQKVPVDPLTKRHDTWILTTPENSIGKVEIAEIHSGSQQISSKGDLYSKW